MASKDHTPRRSAPPAGAARGRPRKAPVSQEGEGEEKRLGRPPLVSDPREEILRQAAKMFAQKGYGASSLAEVAATLNYSKGAIYNYFATKQEIYDAIIIRTLEGLNRAGAEAVAQGASPRERLRLFMIGHARYLAENYDSFVTMLVGYSGMASAALKDDALRLRDAHEGLLRAIIAEGAADGSFRAMDVAMTGRAVLSLLSWMARWYRPDGAMGAEEVADFYCDLIASGLLPREPAAREGR
ncbi:TetR/AcrR family transcriptional regulator [Xanthobacter tagetidis]|uniref:TetR/AcrR family transcriptional regulator n=1 Tax=Xanthobacter tagetidis TaxID=60216 RepID=A0A3L7ANU4_9HYPH|nr:TetR/AcrR family transcriptional regulator [Xanthobacter tagetidis]MBB6307577.1 AcrR family transcriptional regulator [Xanthobacter tagetidis]RLP81148.1 TetR/AcrR family transcriptional regulator [Xanthobacter tagetidis]